MFRTLLLLLVLAASTLAIPTIEAKGAKLFTSDGAQFFIKGIAYQLTEDDPLVDTAQCKRDSALMKTLGANSIRVYHVQSNENHDGCMSAFSDAGIYAWIDLDTTGTYILPDSGAPRWTNSLYSAYKPVMDTFQKYDNVAGFFVGNEMLTKGSDSAAAPFIKAAARDMKAYRDSKNYRQIPIGYSAADIPALRPNLQNYLACGSNSSESLDFYSLNAYEWCGSSSYDTSGYVMLQQNATGYNIPIFMSETGCNDPEPRTFDDQHSIFGVMAGTWSGAIIYEWIQEQNNYGLISYGPSVSATATGSAVVGGFTRMGSPVPISPDFDNLSSQWATLNPTGVALSDYSATANPPVCPTYTKGLWEVSGNVPLPTLGAKGTHYNSAAGTKKTGSGTPTSSSSASSATRASSIALRKRDLAGFWGKLGNWSKAYPVAWFFICAVGAILGIAIVA